MLRVHRVLVDVIVLMYAVFCTKTGVLRTAVCCCSTGCLLGSDHGCDYGFVGNFLLGY